MKIKRGDIWYADLSGTMGSEQAGVRPVVVIQNELGNRFSPTVIVAAVTSQNKKELPTHVLLGRETGLMQNSVVMAEQVRTLSKQRFLQRIGAVPFQKMQEIGRALCVSMELS